MKNNLETFKPKCNALGESSIIFIERILTAQHHEHKCLKKIN